ncbi:MAG: esterase-like activity of phytase family protein [Geminicoccaceae bacterium]|nr:esterase-like activity of phytase family protein [Geminicoccaceae bacterium]MDW8370918.1 esterase-like activity of phytase family protein [Geminicoccaceae bacterium]
MFAILAILAVACTLPQRAGTGGHWAEVRARALPRAELEERLRLGEGVELLAAWRLDSDDPRFGGFSGLLVHEGRLLALSDRGTLWSAPLPDPHGPLAPPTAWQVSELRIGARAPDSEDLARTPDRRLWIALEGAHALAPLPVPAGGDAPLDLEPRPLPEPIAGLPKNLGIEALVALPDGSLLAIGEGRLGETHPALLLRDGRPVRTLGYRPAPSFAPTAAEHIGDWLLVLERRFSPLRGFAARLVAHPARDATDLPAIVEPAFELARWLGSWSIDNLEGLAAEPPDDQGTVRLWLVADDNFNPWQRTLLIALAWRPQPAAAVRASSRRLSRTSSRGSSLSATLLR